MAQTDSERAKPTKAATKKADGEAAVLAAIAEAHEQRGDELSNRAAT